MHLQNQRMDHFHHVDHVKKMILIYQKAYDQIHVERIVSNHKVRDRFYHKDQFNYL